jgi:RNA polymerase sigma-70 factor (ECF subfamily)
MLDTTLDSVNSALNRARAGMRRPAAASARGGSAPEPESATERTLVDRFIRAYEAGDVDALIALVTDDIFVTMPPIPLEYEGREVVARFFAGIFDSGRRVELVPTRANGQPAFGAYLRASDGTRHASGLFVLTLADDRICTFTRFENSVFPWFGLPRSLPGR